jgi:hypothetical protein
VVGGQKLSSALENVVRVTLLALRNSLPACLASQSGVRSSGDRDVLVSFKLDLAVPDGGVRHVLDLCRVARVYNLPALVVLMRPMRAIWLTRTVPRFIGSEPLQYHMAAR